ncbi:nucleoside-diphosphate-sugar pyrophosphorylase [Cenarchaeum symbiosum A]|uniref:Nucleoside-diphosphate-sugar pyrophosphorylase n=1 Tax=Cenarchaeum symbiosum (strain A) TaxID=414004 RepID=A0RUQ3_CENSY|nr:nucleoside-diphosphate-sugar pyrophosphorylase [Cenarchaeum symbiosum A]
MFLPKPMLPLGDRPLLELLIEWARKNGTKSVVLCVSYMRKAIQDYFEDGSRFGVSIEYAVSERPLATAGQLRTAADLVDGTFACLYGDSVFGFSLRAMAAQHRRKRSFITMGLYEYSTTLPYGVIKTGRGGKVASWDEKPEIKAMINMGCYIMEPGVMDLIPRGKSYGMDDVVRRAMSKGLPVGSYPTKKGFMDIGDKESYSRAYQSFVERLGKI